MKRLALSTACFVSFFMLCSQTYIDSNITTNTTWSVDGNPYIISTIVVIEEQVTLNIEPGVIIKKQHNNDLFWVDGTLLALGTEGYPIIFTSISDDTYGGDTNGDGDATIASPGDWGSILIDQISAGSSRFEYCNFRYGGRINGAIIAENSAPYVANCQFNKCRYGFELRGGGIPTITGNHFSDMEKAPYTFSLGSQALISDNTYQNNTFTGVLLKDNDYVQTGDSLLLKRPLLDGQSDWPYIAESYLTVEANTALTILEGVIIKKVLNNDLFNVFGSLYTKGTELQPVIFTSIEDDAYGGDTNNDSDASIPTHGDWGSVNIKNTATDNSELDHCYFLYGGRINGVLMADGQQVKVTNSLFKYCRYAMEMAGTITSDIRNNNFVANEQLVLTITPGCQPLLLDNTFTDNAYSCIGLKDNAYAQSGDSFTLEKISLFSQDVTPYFPVSHLTVDEGVTLNIQPGIIMKKLHNNNLFQVYGTLIARGSAEQAIVFTSIQDDMYGGDSNNDGTASQPSSGVWNSITLNGAGSNASLLEYCLFRYGGRTNGAITINGSHAQLNYNTISHCNKGIEVNHSENYQLKNQNVSFTQIGISTAIIINKLLLDSCGLYNNDIGVNIFEGSASINYCEFTDNNTYDISNATVNAIDARYNVWDFDTMMEVLAGDNPKNLPKLNDQFDNPSLGLIDYAHLHIPDNTVFTVSPNAAFVGQQADSVVLKAYPIQANSRIVLHHHEYGNWMPEADYFIDTLTISMKLDFAKGQIGLYDIWIINDEDTLKKESAFSLLESETPFATWHPFEISENRIYTSGVLLPTAEKIYCFVKKDTHIDYSGTWMGRITISGEEGIVGKTKHNALDMNLLLEDVNEGYYTFEMISGLSDYWSGYIKFCLDPDTLDLNKWENGNILRPYGNDWKVFEVDVAADSMIIQTEGYGKWSNIHVYKDYIGNNDAHWQFNNGSKGYSIKGTISDVEVGKYYLKYLDSAVMTDGETALEDQSREYLVQVSTEGLKDVPQRDISITNVSCYEFGLGPATLDITGHGLADSIQLRLISETDTIMPESLSYDEEANTLSAKFDFAKKDLYRIDLSFVASKYIGEQEKVLVTDAKKEPIDITITGNTQYRVGRRQSLIITLKNTSNVNIENGYAAVEFDSDLVALNLIDDFYSSEYNAAINQAMEEYPSNKMLFFFSNLAPQEQVDIHLRMFSTAIDLNSAILDIKCGSIEPEKYNEVMSIIFNEYITTLKALPFPPDVKAEIEGYEYSDWQYRMNIAMDILHMNHFSFIQNDANIAKALKHQASGHYRTRVNNTIDIVSTGGAVFSALISLVGPGGIYQAGGEVAQNGYSLGLPAGVGDAFGGPLGMATKGVHHLVSIWFKCIAALAGNENVTLDDDEHTHVLEEFVWVKSTTPEDKFGPLGAPKVINDSVSHHYVDTSTVFKYRIDYWNKADATAPAAIVYIRDTLDLDFDLSSFNFTEVGFLKWDVELDGGSYFNVNIDMRPDEPYIVNVEGSLDLASREVYWVHTTLDPLTMQLTEDPLGGYLPPIDHTGYQLGWVSYKIRSKANLPDQTVFTNQAFVNFDGVGHWGAAPKEGPFTNIFDAIPPISTVEEGIGVSSKDSALIKWTGSDTGSGIKDFTIYVSDGNEYRKWLRQTNDTSAWFKGLADKTYHFYCLASDSVGNWEQKEALAEYTLLFTPTSIHNQVSTPFTCYIYPNPARDGKFTVETFAENRTGISIEIINAMGKSIRFIDDVNKIQGVDLSAKPDGLYLIIIRQYGHVLTHKLIKK